MRITRVRPTLARRLDSSIDANAFVVGAPLRMGRAKVVGFFVVGKSGTHDNHIFTLQITADDENWFDTEYTITGQGSLYNLTCVAKSIRATVTTLEGSDSTVDITVMVK